MRKSIIVRVAMRAAIVVLGAALLICLAGCKSKHKDPQKAEACLKSATSNMDACKNCCKEAGYSGYRWTSENCRCM